VFMSIHTFFRETPSRVANRRLVVIDPLSEELAV
jgi:hypothetical protein